jgi:hypothetical protein
VDEGEHAKEVTSTARKHEEMPHGMMIEHLFGYIEYYPKRICQAT